MAMGESIPVTPSLTGSCLEHRRRIPVCLPKVEAADAIFLYRKIAGSGLDRTDQA